MMLIRYFTNIALYSVDLNFKEGKPVFRGTLCLVGEWQNEPVLTDAVEGHVVV